MLRSSLYEKLLPLLRYEYGPAGVKILSSALETPGPRYYLRVNTLKASEQEVAWMLRKEGVEAFVDTRVPGAVYIPVKGPRRIRPRGKWVIADWHAAESVYMGADLYRPGILKAEGFSPGDTVTIYTPDKRPVAVGEAVVSWYEASFEEKGLVVRNKNPVFEVPSILGTRVYLRGLAYDQSLPAQLVALNAEPQEGMFIVDMNAAPGGKTLGAALVTRDKAEILAIDRSPRRLNRLKAKVQMLGLRNVKTLVHDSRYLEEIIGKNEADIVILDPPCTSLGVRPKLSIRRTMKDVLNAAKYQRQFIRAAAKVLKKGGRLVYSTCTLTYSENEGNILYAVRHLGLKPLPQKIFLGEEGFIKHTQRFHPARHHTPGFFIAILEKP